MTTPSTPVVSALSLALLASAPAPVTAASAAAHAAANVVEAVPVSAWLGTPVSVQTLLLALNAPAGPGTGALVPRVPGPALALPQLLPLRIDAAVESRQAFGIDIVAAPGAALLPRGPAAAVSIASADAVGPLVIIIAFN